MRKVYQLIVFSFILGIALFSSFKYIVSIKVTHELSNTITQLNQELELVRIEREGLSRDLEKETAAKQKLIEENLQLSDRLSQLDTQFAEAKNSIERLNSHIALLKAENLAVRKRDSKLKETLILVAQERDTLKERFESVAELKKAIRDLRKRIRRSRLGPRLGSTLITRPRPEVTPKKDDENKGFLLKDGEGEEKKPAKVTIEVTPADLQPNMR